MIIPSRFGIELHLLSFLGDETLVQGKHLPSGRGLEFDIPEIERGAVAWF